MRGRVGAVALVAAAFAIAVGVSSADAGHASHHSRIKHVLLISVDGMHQSDLDWYAQNHPSSELAKLAVGA
jgi:hypothetical protein